MMSELGDEVKGFGAHLEQRQENLTKNITQVITTACLKIEATAKRGMARTQHMPTGRPVTKSGKMHYPSQPGSPPAPDTGTLMRSITHNVHGTEGVVGTNVEYGLDLEFGTSKILARPWLKPAVDAVMPEFKAALIAIVNGEEINSDA